MEWLTQLIAGVGGIAAVASVWITRAATKAQVAKWERETNQKQAELEASTKEAALTRAEDSRKWQASFTAADDREKATNERWQREFDAAKAERERQEARWIREFEHGREQIERQVALFQKQILAQWKALRDRPLLDHRAQALVDFYDSMCKLYAETQMAGMWKSMDAASAAKLGRKVFDEQLSIEFLLFFSRMLAVAPYLPDEIADAIKLAFALIARDLKIIGGIQLVAGDPPPHPSDNERITDGIRALGQMLNPRSPTIAAGTSNKPKEEAKKG